MDIGIGLIGAGVMGAGHARLLRGATAKARLVAVCDADPARAAEAAGGVRLFDRPEALIADPAVGAVVVASPDATHAECVLACLAAGKPVLVEKPLAASAESALAVVRAEEALGRRLIQVGYMRRFDPALREMRAAAVSGAIGRPVLLHNVHRNAAAPEWFTGAMAVTNSFVHEIDQSRWLMGDEIATACLTGAPDGDPFVVTMTTAGGALVSTEVYMNARYGYDVFSELVGTEGVIGNAAPALTVTRRAGQGGHSYPDNWLPRFAAAYRDQMQAWVDSIAAGTPAGASAWDGYVATAIADQIAAAPRGETLRIALPERPALYRERTS